MTIETQNLVLKTLEQEVPNMLSLTSLLQPRIMLPQGRL